MTDAINTTTQQLQALAGSPASSQRPSKENGGSWYEAMANAWGQTLDNQANTISTMSDSLGEGMDSPSQITKLTAESMRMGFMSNASHSSLDSVGKALETMARKG
ncbi:hypothetical protein [Glacieibacterium frigidum]|uniref:Uncharacterized protein n=1 Tax=Glacieibacterium frigidum TaxID=2593303 RepID=A0A552UGM3_9SPHN|nr:hypothetical protein [Glacieibacterium frigidum]TRW17370.1 hypothetical protein FMM06_04130 [Glacieibacterium frigidum]